MLIINEIQYCISRFSQTSSHLSDSLSAYVSYTHGNYYYRIQVDASNVRVFMNDNLTRKVYVCFRKK